MYENAPAANPQDVRGDFAAWEHEQYEFEDEERTQALVTLEAWERSRDAREARRRTYEDTFYPQSSADADMRDYLEGMGT